MLKDYSVVTDASLIDGTFLQGYVITSYQNLVDLFGEPALQFDPAKTRANWVVQFEDGVVATVYDYKVQDKPVEEVTEWNVGGKSHVGHDRMMELIYN